MRRAPPEFADLLTPRVRRSLSRRKPGQGDAFGGARFLAATAWVDRQKALGLLNLLERELLGALVPMEDSIPEWTIRAMQQNYAELLPKTVRVQTALLDSRRERAYEIAERMGLVAMLRSDSFAEFAEYLADRRVRRRRGIQALCYGPGDYSGPHNDHHPEEPEAREGYLDVHLTLATPAVAHQWLVYEHQAHFSKMQSVNTLGGITAYHLPFWHYTTPLVPRRARASAARRWVLLGTFTFQDEVRESGRTARSSKA